MNITDFHSQQANYFLETVDRNQRRSMYGSEGSILSGRINDKMMGFSDIIKEKAAVDEFTESGKISREDSYTALYSDNHRIRHTNGQPVDYNSIKIVECGDYRISSTNDGYLDIRSMTSGEGFRWKLSENKIKVDEQSGMKFLINNLGSGFFNMLPIDNQMENALKESLNVDKLEEEKLCGFTVHQDTKSGINWITADGFEGQGGQIVMNDEARNKLESMADEYMRQYPSLMKNKNEAFFYASFEVRGMVQRSGSGVMMIGPNSLTFRDSNGEDRWTSAFEKSVWSMMKRLFDSNYSNKDANKWDFWDEIMKGNNIKGSLIRPK